MPKGDDLLKIRDEIDSIDDQILALINDRAKLAMKAGDAKDSSNKYKPARESSILNRLTELNEGPLKGNQIRNIFNDVTNRRGWSSQNWKKSFGPFQQALFNILNF